jgi:predicted RNA-binding Zn-ribbon protein involved in translation (DUF1610 family)
VELVLLVIMFVAAGAVAFSALKKVADRTIDTPQCPACGEITTRGYSRCRHCGVEL